MNPVPLLTRSALALVCLLGVAASAAAQEGVYVAGTVFADVRNFGSFSPRDVGDDFSMDATGWGGSVRAGAWLHRRWTIEAGLDLSNRTTVAVRNPYILALFPPGRPVSDFTLQTDTSFASVTTLVGFHQRAGDNVRLGYRAGVSFVRATYRTQIPRIVRTPLVFNPGDPFTIIDIPPFDVEGQTYDTDQNHAALAIGFEAAIEIADDLDVVPELRALAFSRSGSGVFLIRPAAGVRWTF